ncbi:3-(methylthio)propionyl-CoA ligase [Sinimarinibacterium flocculans]|uniref:3-(methylthio)propionyl-CoA ligase n=1 Tax=Sinimarinibacterium flocculans TaxID=985250 RepID=UPI00351690C2
MATPLMGQMMDVPLLISSLLVHAEKYHGDAEIVSRTVEGASADNSATINKGIHRYTYRDAAARARQLANALTRLGLGDGERAATLAWNGYRHFEAYYAISGMGSVVHTINPRLHPEQIAWIANHAEDRVLFFDLTFAPIVDGIAAHCPNVKAWIAMTDRAHMPAMKNVQPLCYEDLLAAESDAYDWPSFDEKAAACLCYTSGTTGNPKGVLYSHRSTLLHAYAAALPDGLSLSGCEVVLPVVPMFHVNAWTLPYVCAMVGAKIVFPGAALDGTSVCELFETERVTFSAGVPTVWLAVLQHLQKTGHKPKTLKRMLVGGSACPPALMQAFERDYGITLVHGWGMTEMSPLGTVGNLKQKHLSLPESEQFAVRLKQGRPPYGVDLKIVDPEGRELPRDGKTSGDLLVRGPWIIDRYFKADDSPLVDGWFPTGDVATLDADGYMQITDRSKDVIKSGGEWISSIDLENIAMAHPAVAMAAVIGIAHPKWDERPLLVVVKKPDADVAREELLKHYEGKIAKWWTPDDVAFTDALPLGATGKVQKNKLREQFRDYTLPTA